MKKHILAYNAVIILTALLYTLVIPFSAAAQSKEELQQQIDSNNAQLAALENEIAQYQKQLDATTQQRNTLQNEINSLDLQRKKLTASINVSKNQIKTTQLEIQQLSDGIATKQSTIEGDLAGIAESLRVLNEAGERSMIDTMLSSSNFSDAWQDADAIATLQQSISADIVRLAAEKQSLTDTKKAAETKKTKLLRQQQELVTQQGALNATRKAQAELLAETKSQESNFQALLAQKQASKASFEAALQDLQARLQYNVDPSSIPAGGRGILIWPVDKVRLTQSFGNTAFALSGAYSGKGHNGIDVAASIGTPIKAALTGVVKGTGDTGLVKGCYSFGRWVLIKHANGLDTLYAHLSQINVKTGDSVGTGQVIGYSGQTGYSTGPHLHFGVYVSSATQVMRLGDATQKTTSCSNAVMPIAPLSAYLDPMKYL